MLGNTPDSPKAVIIGMGATGLACAHYLSRRGWRLVVADTRSNPPGLAQFSSLEGTQCVCGSLSVDLLDGARYLVMSPGISVMNGQAYPLVKYAHEHHIEVLGEVELFARELAHLAKMENYHPKVIGITGTNGKTTTTMLTSAIVRTQHTVIAAGNVGPNALAELEKAHDEGRLPEVWVLELSSFQLATTSSLHCDAAALLNITEDHLDWHGSLKEYAQAKSRIFSPQTQRVLNRQDALCMAYDHPETTRTFGEDAPSREGDCGLLTRQGETYLVEQMPGGEPQAICAERQLQILGRHNALNVLAAYSLAKAIGVVGEKVTEAILTYRGEPHRVEKVLTTSDGVTFVDDSKGTNVGAVIAALRGFEAQHKRVLLVLGGDGKGQDFSPLRAPIEKGVGAVALIGQDAPKLATLLTKTSVPYETFSSLESAQEWLWQQRQPGDIILLSPACASWDMFKNYAERSQRFIACAHRLAHKE